jgi:hypothetical protein
MVEAFTDGRTGPLTMETSRPIIGTDTVYEYSRRGDVTRAITSAIRRTDRE